MTEPTVPGSLAEHVTVLRRHAAERARAGERYAEVITVCGEALEITDSGNQIEFLGALATAAAHTQDIATAEDALQRAVALAKAMESAGGFADRRAETAAGTAYHNLAVHLVAQEHTDRYERAEHLMHLMVLLMSGKSMSDVFATGSKGCEASPL